MPGGEAETPGYPLLKGTVLMRSGYQTKIVVAIAMLLSPGLGGTAGAAPRADLWPRFSLAVSFSGGIGNSPGRCSTRPDKD
jgi:hypothetical protein